MKLNWFRLKLTRAKYRTVLDIGLGLLILFCFAILLAYNALLNDQVSNQKLEIEQYRKKEESAVYLTVDSTGAWLGSYPGAKESPLYNHLGEQVGNLKEVAE